MQHDILNLIDKITTAKGQSCPPSAAREYSRATDVLEIALFHIVRAEAMKTHGFVPLEEYEKTLGQDDPPTSTLPRLHADNPIEGQLNMVDEIDADDPGLPPAA